MKSPLAVAALVALLTCGLVACSSKDPATAGPLSSGLRHGPIPRGSICAPGGEGPFTFGDQRYTNYGRTTVVLDRVVLLDPHNQRLIGSYAVPGLVLMGTVPWPPKPSNGFPIPAAWKDRQAVHGFRVAPGKPFNMVIGVAAIGPGRSTSQGILVYYHDASASYVAKNYFANIIAATGNGCS